jgi:hypothetical protein
MMTFKEYHDSMITFISELNTCDIYFRQIDFKEMVSEPRKLTFAKSIFTRFYENCRNKSENFCVGCFKKLADYCKE